MRPLLRLRQTAGISGPERVALLWALVLVLGVRVALWTLPFRRVETLSGRPVRTSPTLAKVRPLRLSWAVQAVAKRMPGATCLTQALALKMLLARSGRSGSLHIGVAKDRERGFESHAWLELDGEVLVGEVENFSRFRPLYTVAAA